MSGGKERVSASVDPEVANYLQQSSVNASGLINKLVKQHQAAGGTKQAMLKLRREQLKSEVDELENRLDLKKTQLEQVDGKLNEMEEKRTDKIAEAADKLSNRDFELDTMKVSYWMDETGLGKQELKKAIESHQQDTT